MIAALLAALAVWCLLPETATRRAAAVAGAVPGRHSPDLRLVAAGLAPVGGFVLLGPLLGTMVGLALMPAVYRAVGQLESSAARRRAADLAAALPTALDLMVAALEVGRPPVSAFALVADATPAPLGPELAVVASRLGITADPQAVWRTLAQDPALAPLGRAFGRAQESGMPVAEIVSGVASELRRDRVARRREQSRKIAVQTAAPLGACFLPAFFLIGIVPMLVASFSSFLP